MRLLHIIATPRVTSSHTLRIAEPFLGFLQDANPGLQVDTLNLFAEDLPAIAGRNIESKYLMMMGEPIDRQHAESWQQVENLINQFLAADIYVISTPMWNFNIPYVLKYYIDSIVQLGYLFEYNQQGVPVGLCHGKKMVCVTTRGADYSEGGPMHAYDMQEPYLRTIFGFVGIDVQFIHAQPMDFTPDLREAAISAGIEAARNMAAKLELVDH
ncbi:MAG: FMN-dependent NADH-azoreductase [Jatrophihabitantaceae bacterium]